MTPESKLDPKVVDPSEEPDESALEQSEDRGIAQSSADEDSGDLSLTGDGPNRDG